MLVRVKKAKPKLYGNFFLSFESTQDEEVIVTQNNRLIRDIKFVGVIKEAGEDEDDENAPIAGEDEIPDDDLMAIANGGEPSGDGGASEPEPSNVPDDAGGGEEDEDAPIAGEDEIPDNDLMAIANGGEPAGDSPVQADGGDFTAGGGGEDAPATDGPVTDGGDNTQDFTAGANDDGGGDAPQTADDGPTPDGGDAGGGDGPVTDDGQDFTDGADEDGSGGEESDGGDDSGGENDKPGVDYDSMRRYCLYKEFIALHNSVEGYINKLEGITKDNVEENRLLLQSVVNLREIRNLLSDYMTMKFKSDTYFASRLFYQKMIVAVQLVFRAIKTMSSLDNSEKHSK